jgi:hypothetical protein
MGQPNNWVADSGKRTPRRGRPGGSVEVLSCPDTAAQVCRLFHRWGERPVEVAARSLSQAINCLNETSESGLLTAGAGFLWVRMPEPLEARLPSPEEALAILVTASMAAGEVLSALPKVRPVVVFGIDVWATCNRSAEERQVGQFAVLFQKGGPPMLSSKRFPTTGEVAYLPVENPPPTEAPVFDGPVGRVVVMVCHDVNAYSPRGKATTSDAARAGRRQAIRDQVRAADPACGLHLAHHLDKPGSFRQAYNVWASEVGVPLFGVSGLDAEVSSTDAVELARALLAGADGWPVLDLLEAPADGARA